MLAHKHKVILTGNILLFLKLFLEKMYAIICHCILGKTNVTVLDILASHTSLSPVKKHLESEKSIMTLTF